MSTLDGQNGETGGTAPVDLKLEVVVIPVADADRSKAFYAALGCRLDADFSFDNGFRVVQFTPPGSPGAQLDPAATSFNSAGDLARALRRAEAALGEHEQRIGKADPDWPDWYAEYMVREQTGQEPPA